MRRRYNIYKVLLILLLFCTCTCSVLLEPCVTINRTCVQCTVPVLVLVWFSRVCYMNTRKYQQFVQHVVTVYIHECTPSANTGACVLHNKLQQ
jgi:hypothetical protein